MLSRPVMVADTPLTPANEVVGSECRRATQNPHGQFGSSSSATRLVGWMQLCLMCMMGAVLKIFLQNSLSEEEEERKQLEIKLRRVCEHSARES